jgi:hypothetical protein
MEVLTIKLQLIDVLILSAIILTAILASLALNVKVPLKNLFLLIA